jgi:hypothetical protein
VKLSRNHDGEVLVIDDQGRVQELRRLEGFDAVLPLLAMLVDRRLSARAAPEAVQGWQPIETAPKDGTYLLVTRDNLDGSWVAHYEPLAVSGYRFEQPWRSCMLNHDHLHKDVRYLPPTHWRLMPTWLGFPSAPQGDTE